MGSSYVIHGRVSSYVIYEWEKRLCNWRERRGEVLVGGILSIKRGEIGERNGWKKIRKTTTKKDRTPVKSGAVFSFSGLIFNKRGNFFVVSVDAGGNISAEPR